MNQFMVMEAVMLKVMEEDRIAAAEAEKERQHKEWKKNKNHLKNVT